MAIKALIEHLDLERAVYMDLIAVLQAETDHLVNRDYKGLYDTVGRKEHLLLKIDSMGEVRAALLSRSAAAFGVDGFINLSAVIELLKAEEKEELKARQASILSLIDAIKEINKVNAVVVKGSLENINKTLGLLGNFLPRRNYRATGGLVPEAVKGSRLSEGA